MSLISKSLKEKHFQEELLMGYLLLIHAALICHEYDHCWRKLCEIVSLMAMSAADNQKINTKPYLLNIFQIYFLGCNIALRLHKVQLAEHLGYQYV